MKRLMLILVGYFTSVTNASDNSPDELIKMADVKGGLIVQVGCGDGSLTSELRASDSYIVHALDVDDAKVDRARKTIMERGVYGPVSVHLFDGVHLPYSENLVNLLVMRDTGLGIRDEEVMRVLAPGGVLLKCARSRAILDG
ncbi:MAG: class I SAM-dependent methyltransferase [Planctomycetes bacterium]|nr:class I SAM-dependent methyltransferase [Planctomycetota bacterium]